MYTSTKLCKTIASCLDLPPLLQQEDILNPHLGQVVGHRTPDHSSSTHNDLCGARETVPTWTGGPAYMDIPRSNWWFLWPCVCQQTIAKSVIGEYHVLYEVLFASRQLPSLWLGSTTYYMKFSPYNSYTVAKPQEIFNCCYIKLLSSDWLMLMTVFRSSICNSLAKLLHWLHPDQRDTLECSMAVPIISSLNLQDMSRVTYHLRLV